MSAAKPFTRETLEAFARLRGEHFPSSPVMGEALLAYMRWQGQLEETTDRVRAFQDFKQLARHIGYDRDLPPAQQGEFPPFTRMRAEMAQLRQLQQQEVDQFKAKRQQRAEEAQPQQPPPKSREHSHRKLLTKAKAAFNTAWKSPDRDR